MIVDDSWADGGRNNGADPLDTDWWYSTSNQAIEVSVGIIGNGHRYLGTGNFMARSPPRRLSVGDNPQSYLHVHNASHGRYKSQAALRVGLFDGNASTAADLVASSGSPNAAYNSLLGYMMDYDVNFATANIQFRERSVASGQLLASTSDYTNLASGGSVYSIAANTFYTGELTIAKTATGLPSRAR